MKPYYLVILFIFVIAPNCGARAIILDTVNENDSIMTGDILQSCLIDGFVRTIKAYPEKDSSSDIYLQFENCILTEISILKIEQKLHRKVIPICFIAPESNPKEIRDKALIRGQDIWEIFAILEKNELVIRVVPWTLSKHKGEKNLVRILSDWYLSNYEYNCITDSWRFKSLELGGI